MPGGGDTADRIQVRTDRSNSKADTFFPAPKELGRDERHVDRAFLDAITGDVTGGQEVTNLAGSNLTISGGSLQTTGTAPSDAPYVTTGSDPDLSNETVAGVLSDVYGAPVEVGAADLRLDTGQNIEDGSGTERILILSDRTELEFEDGAVGLNLAKGNFARLSAYSGTPVRIRDQEGNFTAVQYDTDASAGLLRTPNAQARIEAFQGPTSGVGLELGFISSNNEGIIRTRDGGTNTQLKTRYLGSPITLESFNGLIDASVEPADLRLAKGQAIEDGGGTERFALRSGGTRIKDENGDRFIRARSGSDVSLFARSGQPVLFEDLEGGFTAVQYTTAASAPGTLELANAVLNFSAGQASTTGDSMTANPESDTEDGFIEVDINGTRFQIPAYTP